MKQATSRAIAAIKRQGAMRKWKNQPTEVDGIRFDSKAEARRWGELCALQQAGKIYRLQRQVRFKLVVNGELIATYVADHTYYDEQERYVVEDVKGSRSTITPEYRLKKKLMAAIYKINVQEFIRKR